MEVNTTRKQTIFLNEYKNVYWIKAKITISNTL